MPARICVALLCIALWLVPRAAFALACAGATVYADDFEKVDPSWAQDDPQPTIDDFRLKLKPPVEGQTLFISGIPLPEGEICVTLRSPNDMADPSATQAGLVFRAVHIPGASKNGYSYMFFGLSPDGTASLSSCVIQNQRDTTGGTHLIPFWRTIQTWPNLSGMRKGRGATNALRVTLRRAITGIDVSLFVNETRLELEPLSLPLLVGGGEIGLRAVSEKGRTDTWKFSELLVTDLP